MLAGLVLTAVAFLYFFPVLDFRSILVERDLSAYYVPPRFIAVHIASVIHQFPFWNPYNLCGTPLMATTQHGILYPPNLLHLVLPFGVAWNLIIVLHFAFAGVSIYALLRYLKASKISSLLGALVFMLSGYLISIHSLLTHLLAIPWVPLVVLAFLKYLHRRTPAHLCLTAFLLAMIVFSGGLELLILVVPALLLMLFWRRRDHARDRTFLPETCDCHATGDGDHDGGTTASPIVLTERAEGASVSLLRRFAVDCRVAGLLIVLFLLLSAVQLVPFLELKSLSIRSGGLSYQEATIWSFAWRDFILFLLPDAFGYFQNEARYWANQAWLKTVYLGIAPFVLAIYYFLTNDRKRLFFTVLIVLSFLFALGGNTPLYRLLYLLPPFNSIRYPVKFLFLFFLVISIISALGFDALGKDLADRVPRARRFAKVVFYAGFIFAAAWGFSYFFDSSLHAFLDRVGIKPGSYNEISFNLHNLKRFLLFSFVFCVMILVLLRSKRKAVVGIVIVVVIGLDLFFANFGFFLAVPQEYYFSKNPLIARLMESKGEERYYVTEKTQKDFKNFPHDKTVCSPYYAALYGLYTVGGTEVMRVGRNDAVLAILNSRSSPQNGQRIFDILGVRHIVSSYPLSGNMFSKEAHLSLTDKNAYVSRYDAMPGRFLLYTKARFSDNDGDMVKLLVDDAVDLKSEVLISSSRSDGVDRGGEKGSAKLLTYTPNMVVIETVADKDAFLYVGDTYYPGWKAYINGQETPILRANLAFRAVAVPPGRHTVIFRYIPLSFYGGMALTFLGFLFWIVSLVRERRKGNHE